MILHVMLNPRAERQENSGVKIIITFVFTNKNKVLMGQQKTLL